LLLYRIYAPYDGTTAAPGTAQYEQFIAGGVSLPSLSTAWTGAVAPQPLATLRPCAQRNSEPFLTALAVAPIAQLIQQAATPAPQPLFQYNGGGSLFPNADNKYVYSTTTWKTGRLIILTGSAPTFPNTNAQAIVQTPPAQLRYWSLCTNKDMAPAPVVQCADDQNTSLFAPVPGSMIPSATTVLYPGTTGVAPTPPPGSLQYAYVISATVDKPANLDPKFTWLPWFAPADEPPSPGSQVPGTLILRNMLPISTFTQAVQNIPQNGPSAAAALLASLSPPPNPALASDPVTQAVAVMGTYYPRAVYCDRSVFAAAYAVSNSVSQTIGACVAASTGL
jgi:hypothetical protein